MDASYIFIPGELKNLPFDAGENERIALTPVL